MSEYDDLLDDVAGLKKASDLEPVLEANAPVVSEAEKRGWTREQAIAHGRKLAEHENDRLAQRRPDYVAENRRDRIERAERYAAWEYDGRLAGTIGKKRG